MCIKRKIIAVTGARSEYDLLSPLFQMLHDDNEIEFGIIVTGSHLSETFGSTVKNIESDGYIIYDRIYNLIDTNEKIGRVISLGNQIGPLAQSFNRIKPDLILIAGDREEAISVTMTAAFLNIPTAHFFGGDIAKDGNIDNSVRYASSKFAHIHFPTLDSHRQTLLKLGEDDWRIHVVGNPALDKFINAPLISREILSKHLNFDISNEKYAVLIQHSIIDQVENQSVDIRKTLDAIVESGMKCLINSPNSDAGHYDIIEAYREYESKYENLHCFKNLERDVYINLLRNASVLLGNSSSGLLEAPSIKLPAINIGSRQRGREHGNNVIFVDNDKNEILNAIIKTQRDNIYIKSVNSGKNPYGDGKSSLKIYHILKNIELNDRLIYKNITY